MTLDFLRKLKDDELKRRRRYEVERASVLNFEGNTLRFLQATTTTSAQPQSSNQPNPQQEIEQNFSQPKHTVTIATKFKNVALYQNANRTARGVEGGEGETGETGNNEGGIEARENAFAMHRLTIGIEEYEEVPPLLVMKTLAHGEIQGFPDTGATICAVSRDEFSKCKEKYGAKRRATALIVQTGQGVIKIRDFFEVKISDLVALGGRTIRFYVLPCLPSPYVFSWRVIQLLGYGLVPMSEGYEVTSTQEHETTSPDSLLHNSCTFATTDIRQRGRTSVLRQSLYLLTGPNKGKRTPLTEVKEGVKDSTGVELYDLSKMIEEALEDSDVKDDETIASLRNILWKYRDTFARHEFDIGKFTEPEDEFVIELECKEEEFRNDPMRRFKREQIAEGRRQIHQWVKHGWAEPSCSPIRAQLVLVKKKGNKVRVCQDYRKLNAKTRKDSGPIVGVPETLHEIGQRKFFSVFDAKAAYHHIPVARKSRHLTSFTDGMNLWQLRRMGFGFVNAPSHFQRVMRRKLYGLRNVVMYLDDIIIASNTKREHLQDLKAFFKRTRRIFSKLNLNKSVFLKTQVKYLGHILAEGKILPDPDYIHKVIHIVAPTTHKQAQAFVGMVNWIGRFLPNLATRIKNITKSMVKPKGVKYPKYVWTKECEEERGILNKVLEMDTYLLQPDPTKEFVVHTDASDDAIGAVLLQENDAGRLWPVEYLSKTLNEHQKNWSISEKELFALIYAYAVKWRHHLIFGHSTVFTDHLALKYLLESPRSTPIGRRLQRWVVSLSEFDMTVDYIKGTENVAADALSRFVLIGKTADQITRRIESYKRGHTVIQKPGEMIRSEETNVFEQAECATKRAFPLSHRTSPTRLATLRRGLHEKKVSETKYVSDSDEELIDGGERKSEERDLVHLTIPKELEARGDKMLRKRTRELRVLWGENRPKADVLLDFDRIREAQLDDCELKIIMECLLGELESHWQLGQGWKRQLTGGIYEMNHKGCVVRADEPHITLLPPKLRGEVIMYFHEGTLTKHLGAGKTTDAMKDHVYWPNMHKDVNEYVRNCQICWECKAGTHATKSNGLRTPWHAKEINEVVAMDMVGPLTKSSKGFVQILTIQDKASRYVKAIPLRDITATTVALAFFNHWICVFGVPKCVLSDRGSQFTGAVMDILNKTLGIQQILTSAYYPEGNGSIERFHRYLKENLVARGMDADVNWLKHHSSWSTLLPVITCAYNTTVCRATKFAPHVLMFGTRFSRGLKWSFPDRKLYKPRDAHRFRSELKRRHKAFKKAAERAQVQYDIQRKKHMNKGRKPHTYRVGEYITMRVMGTTGNAKKLAPRYKGKAKIIELIGPAHLMVEMFKEGRLVEGAERKKVHVVNAKKVTHGRRGLREKSDSEG